MATEVNPDSVMCTIPVLVHVTIRHMMSFIKVINKYDMDCQEKPLTIEEVNTNPDLCEYICKEAVEDGTAMYDPTEFHCNDGWSDIRLYRK